LAPQASHWPSFVRSASETSPLSGSLVESNGCTTQTKSVDPSPCVEYQGCQAGYPVVWCVRPGDPHAIPSFGAAAIARFFQQF
jgi:hypothetical protein